MPPSQDQTELRKEQILKAGLDVLVEKGWGGTSMIAVARRAKASKETLYNWFGDKAGFFAAMIRQNADALDASLPGDFQTLPLEEGLRLFGQAYLELITGAASIAINRAAIAEAGHDPALGKLLLQEGKAKSLPRLAQWISTHQTPTDPMQAAERFTSLLKGDMQWECLLGACDAPSPEQITCMVDRAVQDYLRLYPPG